MSERVAEHYFDSRADASVAAADFIAAAVSTQLATRESASLIVTGGSSPAACYAALAARPLDWSRVQVLLSDERWVPPNDSASNERLVRDTLLQDAAAAAQLLPMYSANTSPEERGQALNRLLPSMLRPCACALLGMGGDGHIASLFPDAGNLAEGLDADGAESCIVVRTAASEHLRISLTLAALLQSDVLVLLFFGTGKRAVYEQARAASSELPVAKLLAQKRTPVHVFWAA